MKRILLTILAMTLCLAFFSGCENSDVKFNDFSDYKNDFEAIVDYVSDFPPHTINTIISSHTLFVFIIPYLLKIVNRKNSKLKKFSLEFLIIYLRRISIDSVSIDIGSTGNTSFPSSIVT